MFLSFNPDDVVSLHSPLKEKGYKVTGLRVTFRQMNEFELEDPDGYQIWFGEDADVPSTCE